MRQQKLWILSASSIVVFLLAVLLPPIAQPSHYHDFADQKLLFGIPSFFNVVSNLTISLSGIAGLWVVWRASQSIEQRSFIHKTECWPYLIFFLMVVATGVGSAYYHWSPDNETLLWDRLPIAMGVTALLAAVLVERVSLRVGLWSLPLLVVLGAVSVMYWYWTEQQGAGNLNYYIVVQFYSLLLILVLGWIFPSKYTRGGDLNKVIGLYALAKVAETFDQGIYSLGHMISGHTIKHLMAALAIYLIVRMLQKRVFINQ